MHKNRSITRQFKCVSLTSCDNRHVDFRPRRIRVADLPTHLIKSCKTNNCASKRTVLSLKRKIYDCVLFKKILQLYWKSQGCNYFSLCVNFILFITQYILSKYHILVLLFAKIVILFHKIDRNNLTLIFVLRYKFNKVNT